MSHREDMQRRVDAVIAQHVIAPMNELLIALSDDAQLSREERYDLQQQLRTAIAHHGRQHKEDRERESAERLAELTRGGTIL